MTSSKLRIRTSLLWFPAPVQWETLIVQLSDGAFKLFVYVCLKADRATARLNFRETALARDLGKSRRSVAAYLRELRNNDVCSITMSANQHAAGIIQIQSTYWPYEAQFEESITRSTQPQPSYLHAVEGLLRARSCVCRRFTGADRELAQEWLQRQIPLWQIEQAVLIGCARKYISWLNGADSRPIGSLRYFEQVLEEVIQTNLSPDYWDFNKVQLAKIEQKWLASQAKLSRACANLSQAK